MRAPLLAHTARRTQYPFELRDPVDGRRVRARFIARLKEIAGCCAAWEILSPPLPPESTAKPGP
ncbi:MAG: hypothetical protein U1F54_16410 [Burkholderiales bacterium]